MAYWRVMPGGVMRRQQVAETWRLMMREAETGPARPGGLAVARKAA